MKWANSLIRIANHEVESLQKRLAGIMDRRNAAELRLTVLHAEA
jgi:flagellar protein FliJ